MAIISSFLRLWGSAQIARPNVLASVWFIFSALWRFRHLEYSFFVWVGEPAWSLRPKSRGRADLLCVLRLRIFWAPCRIPGSVPGAGIMGHGHNGEL